MPHTEYECQLIFPTNVPITTESPGLLLEIKKLNIPCNSNSYINLPNSQKRLCGKIEDISIRDRVLYFPLQENTTLHLRGSPTFKFFFKLVDYCHNVTLTSRNSSILIRTKSEMKCYIKILVPYGNTIELHMIQYDMGDQYEQKNVSLDWTRMSVESFKHSNDTVCADMNISVEEWGSKNSWRSCNSIKNSTIVRRFKSSSNSFVIKLTTPRNIGTIDNRQSIYFEYDTIPIQKIVSQCEYGWIRINQFCVMVSSLKLSWKQAELYCENLGGHLASIKSGKEQMIIDDLLVNR